MDDKDLLYFYYKKEDKSKEMRLLLLINSSYILLMIALIMFFSVNTLFSLNSLYYEIGSIGLFMFFGLPMLGIKMIFYSFDEIDFLITASKSNLYEDLRMMEKYSFEELLSSYSSYAKVVAKRKWLKLTDRERMKILSSLLRDTKSLEFRKELLNLSRDVNCVKRVKKIQKQAIIF